MYIWNQVWTANLTHVADHSAGLVLYVNKRLASDTPLYSVRLTSSSWCTCVRREIPEQSNDNVRCLYAVQQQHGSASWSSRKPISPIIKYMLYGLYFRSNYALEAVINCVVVNDDGCCISAYLPVPCELLLDNGQSAPSVDWPTDEDVTQSTRMKQPTYVKPKWTDPLLFVATYTHNLKWTKTMRRNV